MVNAFPASQLSTTDTNCPGGLAPGVTPVLQFGGFGIPCATGFISQEVLLAAASSTVALAFPTGVTTAKVVYIAAGPNTTDLIVKVGGTPFSLQVPAGQGIFLYNITSANVSLNTVLGGLVSYAVGG